MPASERGPGAVTIAIETSGPRGGVAVGVGATILGVLEFGRGLVHGREVVPRLRDLFAEKGLDPRSVAAVAVDVGPGSYTGLRVGISAARALAFATGAKTIAVAAFDAVAADSGLPPGTSLLAVRDARRGHVYAAVFAPGGSGGPGALVRATEDFAATPEEAAARAPTGAVVLGDGAAAYPQVFGPPRFVAGPHDRGEPRVAAVYRLGASALARGETTPADALVPRYLQASEPERRRTDR